MRVRAWIPLVVVASFASEAPACGQRFQADSTGKTPQAWAIRQIQSETDEVKKLDLLKAFTTDYPTDASIGWVYWRLHDMYLDARQFDLALGVAEKLLAIDPNDLELAHRYLKSAEEKKDAAQIKKWTERISQMTSRVLAAKGPANPYEREVWPARVELAKQLRVYLEYLDYVEILQCKDLRKKLKLIDDFATKHPQSQYGAQLLNLSFNTYRQMGDTRSAATLAERMLEKDENNEDILILVAENHFQKDREQDKALAYSAKIIDLMETKPKPDDVSEADWQKKKALLIGRANWMIGRTAMDFGRYAQADRALRAALPALRGNNELTAAALFFLGWANYKTGNLVDAVKYNQQCLSIRSSYAEQAAKNLSAIQAERAGR